MGELINQFQHQISEVYHRRFFQGLSIYISTLSLTAIALDRLEAVVHTNYINTNISKRPTIIKIFFINFISMLAILPYCLHMKVREAFNETSLNNFSVI